MLGGIVRGRRTVLRVPTADDLPSIASWMADLRVRRACAVWHEPAAAATWKERLTEAAKDEKSVLWAIDASGDGDAGRLVGMCRMTFGWNAPISDSVEPTHFILDPAEWRKGQGWDAALALHRYVFDYLHLRRSEIAVRADNAAALRIAERLGYREYAHGHAVHWRDGAYVDEIRLRMDLDDWDARWSAEREYEPLPAEAAR
ncbi:MAG: GNAT family N-acetyltransferase [Candidatus Limnocylindria bacterium]